MDILEEALQEMNEAFLAAKTPFGIAEGNRRLNDANRAVIHAMQQKNGEVYLLTVNSKDGLRKCEEVKTLTNFCCDFCVPVNDQRISELTGEWNRSMQPRVLTALYYRLNVLGAVMLIWS